MSIGREFKEFAVRGNMIDLAVGVVVGGAFGQVVSSLVADVVMPPLGKLIGGINFSDFAVSLGTGPKGAPILLKYGVFIQTVIDFLIVAFVIFLAVRGINKLRRPPPPAPVVEPPPTKEEILLTQIRDALVKQGSSR